MMDGQLVDLVNDGTCDCGHPDLGHGLNLCPTPGCECHLYTQEVRKAAQSLLNEALFMARTWNTPGLGHEDDRAVVELRNRALEFARASGLGSEPTARQVTPGAKETP